MFIGSAKKRTGKMANICPAARWKLNPDNGFLDKS
jgi:hypothetical protein